MRLLISFLLLCILASISYSQGEYLSAGESGLSAGYLFGSYDDGKSNSYGFGYTYSGMIELGVTFNKRNTYDDTYSGKGNSFYAKYFITKQTDEKKIQIGLSLSIGSMEYTRETYSGDVDDYIQINYETRATSIGVFTQPRITIPSWIEAYGILAGGIHFTKVSNFEGDGISVSESNISFNLGFGFLLNFNKHKLAIEPIYSKIEDNDIFSLGFVYIFRTSS